MISVLLTILKILGIILLSLLGLCVLVIVLVLFVPVRYRITAHRKTEENVPFTAIVRISWLLHILNAAFAYPEAAYVRVRVFCFTVFCSDRKKKEKAPESKKQEKRALEAPAEKKAEPDKEKQGKTEPEVKKEGDIPEAVREGTTQKQTEPAEAPEKEEGENAEAPSETEEKPGIIDFFKRLWELLKNIGYTIRRIYDKIKHIIKNIRYYIKVIQSDTFRKAFGVCSAEFFELLRYLRPGKFTGELLVGMDDPASTGQILAVWGMLYPLIGEHINITPDFERQILEGDLLIAGRITVFRLIKTAWIIYFNKDLRHLIHLLKREDIKNGRK